jgi:hypothetical protein
LPSVLGSGTKKAYSVLSVAVRVLYLCLSLPIWRCGNISSGTAAERVDRQRLLARRHTFTSA